MRALGELLLSNLTYKSFIDFSTDLIGPWAGYFVGWTYWLCWITIGIADLSAIIYYLQFFNNGLPFSPVEGAMISVAAIVFIMGLNLLTVRLFGELEFWFALIKILAIIILIAVGLWMIFTGFTSTTGEVASFTHLWANGGFFPTGVHGFLAGFRLQFLLLWVLNLWEQQLRKLKTLSVICLRRLTQFQSVSLFSMYWRYSL